MKQKQPLDISILVIGALIAMTVFISSCTVYITPHQAANGKAKCGRGLR